MASSTFKLLSSLLRWLIALFMWSIKLNKILKIELLIGRNLRKQIKVAVSFYVQVCRLFVEFVDDQVDFFDAFKLIHLLGLFALLEQLNLFLGNLVRLLTEPLLLVYDVVNVAVGEAVSVVRLQLLAFDRDFGLSRQRQTLKTI